MKKLALILTTLFAVLPIYARADSLLEKIATELLADRFGIDVRDILGVRRETREDVWDLGPVYSMSRYGNSQPSEVQRLRASGMGWGNIAKRIGMHPGTFNKLRNQGYFDRDPFWDDICRRRYGVRQDEIDGIRRRGARPEDVLGTIIVAKGCGKPVSEVYGRYRETKNWDRTADRYKVDLNRWEGYGKRVRWEGSSASPAKATPPVKSKGKGNGNGKGKGKGNGKGKGKGHGNRT